MAVATTLSVLSVAFPPLAILASAAKVADGLIAAYQDGKAASEHELRVIKEGIKQYGRFKDDMQEFEGCADSVNKLLAVRELDTDEVIKYKNALDKVYEKWEEQVQAMKDITDAQQQRLRERGSTKVMDMGKRVFALGSGQVKKVAEKEEAQIVRIKSEAQGFKGELSQKAGDFINRLTASPFATGSPGKGKGWWGGGGSGGAGASPATPRRGAFEKEYAVLTDSSGSASPLERIRRGLAAAANATRAGMPDQAYLCLQAVVKQAMPDYNAQDEADTLRLSEASMADVVACLQQHGTSNAPIAERAWQVVHKALGYPEEEAFDGVAAMWGRSGILACAGEGLAFMTAPANATAWGDCVDDLCTAVGLLCQGSSLARDLLAATPQAPALLAQVVRDNAVDPDVYRGALTALAALFERCERHPEEPGSVFALAQALFPGSSSSSSSSSSAAGDGGGAAASQRPPLCVALIKVLRSKRVGAADEQVFALCNAVLASGALPGLEWLGPRLLEWEDLDGHSVLSESLAYMQGKARSYVQVMGAASGAEGEEEGEGEEGEEEGEAAEEGAEAAAGEADAGAAAEEDFPMEVANTVLEPPLAMHMLTFLHYLLSGCDLEQRIEKRVLLPPDATARYYAAAIARDSIAGAACIDLLLCTITDLPLYHQACWDGIELAMVPALAFLLSLARGRGAAAAAASDKLGALPGAMAAYCAAHPDELASSVRYIAKDTELGKRSVELGALALRLLKELEATPCALGGSRGEPAKRAPEEAGAGAGVGGCCSIA